jgi:outer membrane receptor protein involved in Fe transport
MNTIHSRSSAPVCCGMLLSLAAAHAEEVSEGNREEALETVVVTATRREQRLEDVPASIAVQDVEALRRDGFTYGTDEFRGVPGVFFRRGEGDGDEFPFVSIRGSTGTEGYLAMIDGVPLMGVDEEPLLSQVPYDALERVEIVKGPVSALYGRGALYGAVNYITRSKDRSATGLTFSAGADDYYRMEGVWSRPVGASANMLLSAAYEDNGGWRENSARELANLFGKFRFDLGERTALTLYANYADRSSQLPNGLPLRPDGELIEVVGGREAFLGYGRPRNDQEVAIGAARIEHHLNDALEFAVTAQARRVEQSTFWNFYDPFGFDPSRNVYAINGFAGDTNQSVWYAEATLRWRTGRHDIVAGVSGERSKVDSQDRWSGQFGFTPACGFAFFLIEIDYTTGAIVNADHPCFLNDALYTSDHFTNTFQGVFLQDEIRLSERWYLTAGSRYDNFRRRARFDPIEIATAGGRLEGDADAFSPKASLSWRYDAGQVYFAYGRGFNANFGATFEWDAAQYARPEHRPSTLDSYELGWKTHLLDQRLRIEASVFHTRQKNRRLIIPNPDAENDFTAPANLITYGQLYDSRGAELTAHVKASDRTELTFGYSYLDPEWNDYVLATFAGPVDLSDTTPVGVPQHIGYFAAEHRFTHGLSTRASFEHYDDYMITQDNGVEDGGYELLNLNVRLQPASWSGMSLDLSLLNALDEDYYFYFGGRSAATYATPGTPRQWRITLRTSF